MLNWSYGTSVSPWTHSKTDILGISSICLSWRGVGHIQSLGTETHACFCVGDRCLSVCLAVECLRAVNTGAWFWQGPAFVSVLKIGVCLSGSRVFTCSKYRGMILAGTSVSVCVEDRCLSGSRVFTCSKYRGMILAGTSVSVCVEDRWLSGSRVFTCSKYMGPVSVSWEVSV